MIEPATSADAMLLTQIMRASKAHWGYSSEQLKAWEEELSITAAHFDNHIVFKLIEEGKIIGFYSLIPKDQYLIWMEDLFIDPNWIGKGKGGILLEHAIEQSRKMAFREMGLEADPNAEYFYLRKGFSVIGQQPTSIPGRFMPVMRKVL